MRYGHFMGFGYNGAFILVIALIMAVVVLIVFLLNSKKEVNPKTQILLEILKERYARDEIKADEYRERKMIIEEDESFDPTMLVLKERYAKGEIDSSEFCTKRDEKQSGKINNALDILNQRYAKGEISSDEYKRIKKDIQ